MMQVSSDRNTGEINHNSSHLDNLISFYKFVQVHLGRNNPYDNAPMEKYFNTLKTELLNVHEYSEEKELYKAINDFAYIWYNQNRTHTYNNHKTTYEVRFAA